MKMDRRAQKSYDKLKHQLSEANARAEGLLQQVGELSHAHVIKLDEVEKKWKDLYDGSEISLGQEKERGKILRASLSNIAEDLEQAQLALKMTVEKLEERTANYNHQANVIAKLQADKNTVNIKDLRNRLHVKTEKISELERKVLDLEKALAVNTKTPEPVGLREWLDHQKPVSEEAKSNAQRFSEKLAHEGLIKDSKNHTESNPG